MTGLQDRQQLAAAHRLVEGADQQYLILCDHASAALPPGTNLGVQPEAMESHIAVDIGAQPLAVAIGQQLQAPVWLGRWSRLWCDVNRPIDSPALAPAVSDAIIIPGNQQLSAPERARREEIHSSFHEALSQRIQSCRPRLLLSIHSFTPCLAADPAPRPWPVAVLWNRDSRGAELALAALADEQLPGPVGANEPYSGQVLNYTMDRHAEGNAIPYAGFEVRQDLISDAAGVDHWAGILSRVIQRMASSL